MDHNDIQELKQQFEVLLGAYNTEKHQREQLENVVASTAEKFQLLEHKVILWLHKFSVLILYFWFFFFFFVNQ